MLDAWYSLVTYINNLFGLGLEQSALILILILSFFVIFLILIFLLKFFKKTKLKNEKELIYQYDYVFYLLALSQYELEFDKESVGGDPCIAAIKPIINSQKPSYIKDHNIVYENVLKIEKMLGKQIINDDVRSKIKKYKNKFKINIFLINLFRLFVFLILAFFVVGVFYIKINF